MALPSLVVDDLDSVEESERVYYEEKEGKHHFSYDLYNAAIKKPLVEKNAQLKAEKDKLKPIADKFKDIDDKKFTRFQEWDKQQGDKDDDDRDDDGDDDKDDKDDRDDKDDKRGKDDRKPTVDKATIKAAVRAKEKELTDAHKAELKERDDKIEALERKFESDQIEREFADLALEAGVVPERLKEFKKVVLERFARKDGKLVYLEDGEESLDITPKKALDEVLFKEYPYFFEDRSAGGGSGKQKGKPGTKDATGPFVRSKMTNEQKKDYIAKYGQAKYLALPMK